MPVELLKTTILLFPACVESYDLYSRYSLAFQWPFLQGTEVASCIYRHKSFLKDI